MTFRAAFLLVVSLLACSPAGATQRLIYDSPLPQNEYGARGVRDFAAKVLHVTGGEVEILVRQNGVLGLTGAETLAAVREGLVVLLPVLRHALRIAAGHTSHHEPK